jgi:hypothetical protein
MLQGCEESSAKHSMLAALVNWKQSFSFHLRDDVRKKSTVIVTVLGKNDPLLLSFEAQKKHRVIDGAEIGKLMLAEPGKRCTPRKRGPKDGLYRRCTST